MFGATHSVVLYTALYQPGILLYTLVSTCIDIPIMCKVGRKIANVKQNGLALYQWIEKAQTIYYTKNSANRKVVDRSPTLSKNGKFCFCYVRGCDASAFLLPYYACKSMDISGSNYLNLQHQQMHLRKNLLLLIKVEINSKSLHCYYCL